MYRRDHLNYEELLYRNILQLKLYIRECSCVCVCVLTINHITMCVCEITVLAVFLDLHVNATEDSGIPIDKSLTKKNA